MEKKSIPALPILPFVVEAHECLHGLECLDPEASLTKPGILKSLLKLQEEHFVQSVREIANTSQLSCGTRTVVIGNKLFQNIEGLRTWIKNCLQYPFKADDGLTNLKAQMIHGMKRNLRQKKGASLVSTLDVAHDLVHSFADHFPGMYMDKEERAEMTIQISATELRTVLFTILPELEKRGHPKIDNTVPVENRTELIAHYLWDGNHLLKTLEPLRRALRKVIIGYKGPHAATFRRTFGAKSK